jgi:hypothetical protein
VFPVKFWARTTGKFRVVSEGDRLRKSINESSGRKGQVPFFKRKGSMKAGSAEVRALQRSSAALQTEIPITIRACPHEPAWNWGTVAKETVAISQRISDCGLFSHRIPNPKRVILAGSSRFAKKNPRSGRH